MAFLFGAGYGSRTRLLGLGSRCTTDVRILHMKFSLPCSARQIREYSGSCAASVSLRIFFWLCQKLRCCASRPSCGGKMLVIEPASSAWEADVLPMYESCVAWILRGVLGYHSIFFAKKQPFSGEEKKPGLRREARGIQQSLAPAGMASSSMTRWSFSSPFSLCTAESSMPHDSWPIIFLGGRLTMAASVLPTRASGS